jgi:hypothetical protein
MLVVLTLALAATFLCRQIDLLVDLPTDVISIAVIFPVVFTIAEAHHRREEALRNFASMKASAISLYLAHRDWPVAPYDLTAEGERLTRVLLTRASAYFTPPLGDSSRLSAVYEAVSEVSVSHRRLLAAGVQTSELSRVSQFLREFVADFERMRNFAHYRTPIALRSFSRLFLTTFPILFSPYFAFVGYPEHPWLGYAVAIVYCMVLVGLDNVQEQLENPYDGFGPDDLKLDVLDEYDSILRHDSNPGHVAASSNGSGHASIVEFSARPE